jgi:hypothetical protein
MKKMCANVTQGLGIVIGLMILSLLLINTKEVSSDTVNPGLYSPDSKPFGSSYADWTAKFWQWYLKIPNSQHPFGDSTGVRCGVMQNGPVWFLVGSAGKVERNCTIPSDKAILIPVINMECSYSESPDLKDKKGLTDCAITGNNGAKISASVDNHPIVDLDKYRVATDIFNVTYANDPVTPTNSNVSQAVSDGWYLFLEPMKPGQHEIKFKATILGDPTSAAPGALIDATYHITTK